MNNSSNLLCHTRLSQFLIDEIKLESQESLPLSLISDLGKEINNKSDLSDLVKNVESLKKHISEGLYDSILEELNEIKSDLKWIRSKKGQYIASINDWSKSFHKEFRSIKEFQNILIGGHTERMVVFIVGKLNTNEEYKRLLNYVESKKPPYKMYVQIEILEHLT